MISYGMTHALTKKIIIKDNYFKIKWSLHQWVDAVRSVASLSVSRGISRRGVFNIKNIYCTNQTQQPISSDFVLSSTIMTTDKVIV